MIQWVGLGLALIGFLYNGFKDYQNGTIKIAPLTNQTSAVEYARPQPIMTWQVAFDPNTGKLYHQHQDGKWYEQVPQIRADQTQHSPAVGVGQGSQSAPLGQRPAQQQAQTAPNPWFR